MADDTRARVRPELHRQYDSWRTMGMTEAQAVECLRGHDPLSTVLVPNAFEDLAEGLASFTGGSVDAARRVNADRMGMSEARAAEVFNESAAVRSVPDLERIAKAAAASDARLAESQATTPKPAPAKPVRLQESAGSLIGGVLNELVAKYEAQGKPFAEALALAEAEINPERAKRLASMRVQEAHGL